MKRKQATLCFLTRPGEVLLAMKKRGFGKDRFNGIGGKVEPGETVEQATRREVAEEIGVRVGALKAMAAIQFFYHESPSPLAGEGRGEGGWCQEVFVFTATQWEGMPQETDEMAPQWFSTRQLPFEKMWPDDPYWLPKVLSGEAVKASFEYNSRLEIENHAVTPIKALPDFQGLL